ncbi:unnamed protein product [Pleuronectes platessa]|uniref:Uncharacterized protein n=1 Tax=Pleuronectes platessa TaxID=8262 RepID=A0A9N7VKK9_PLEPL|nr:unnamed protein product [Pleuronectes platessa]
MNAKKNSIVKRDARRGHSKANALVPRVEESEIKILDLLQVLMGSSFGHGPPIHKISRKSVSGKTDRQKHRDGLQLNYRGLNLSKKAHPAATPVPSPSDPLMFYGWSDGRSETKPLITTRGESIKGREGCRCDPSASVELCEDFADSIFHLVREKYRSLVGGCSPAHARHKSLAGIVMTQARVIFKDPDVGLPSVRSEAAVVWWPASVHPCLTNINQGPSLNRRQKAENPNAPTPLHPPRQLSPILSEISLATSRRVLRGARQRLHCHSAIWAEADKSSCAGPVAPAVLPGASEA